MDLYLKGKTAIVTGGSQGIGRAIAKELALEGVKVLVTARNQNLLVDLKNEVITEGGVEPEIFVQDFSLSNAPQNIADAARTRLGTIDILVNNTGRSRPLDVVGEEEAWNESMTLDFSRHRQLTQMLLSQFIEQKQGSIINIISSYELRSINASAVAKAAVVAWSKQLAGQLGRYNVRINCIQPGLIDTANIRPFFPGDEGKKFAAREIPLGSFGHPQDMANMAAFLASPRARYITGAVAVVDGGMRHYPF